MFIQYLFIIKPYNMEHSNEYQIIDDDCTYSRGHTNYGSYSALTFTYACEDEYFRRSSSYTLNGTNAVKMKYFRGIDWTKEKIVVTHTVPLDDFNALLNFVNGYEVLRKKYNMAEIINMLDLMNILQCAENTINRFCAKSTSYLDLNDICLTIKDLAKDDKKIKQIIANINLNDSFTEKEIKKLMIEIRNGSFKDVSLDIKLGFFNLVFYYFEHLDKFKDANKFLVIFGKTRDDVSCEYCTINEYGNGHFPKIIIEFCDHFGVEITSSKLKIKKWQVKKLLINKKEIPLKVPTDNVPESYVGVNLENTIRHFLSCEIAGLDY